jgi:hypothetical protein
MVDMGREMKRSKQKESKCRDRLLALLAKNGWNAVSEVSAWLPGYHEGGFKSVRIDILSECPIDHPFRSIGIRVVGFELKREGRTRDYVGGILQSAGYMQAFNYRKGGLNYSRPDFVVMASPRYCVFKPRHPYDHGPITVADKELAVYERFAWKFGVGIMRAKYNWGYSQYFVTTNIGSNCPTSIKLIPGGKIFHSHLAQNAQNG